MENKKISNSDRVKSAIAYIPLAGIFLYFTENNKSSFLSKHIKYGNILFVGFIILRIVFVTIFLSYILGSLISIVYILAAGIIGYKVYSGEDINIDYVDKFENKIKDEMDDSKDAKEIKKDDFDEGTDDAGKTGNAVIDGLAGGLTNVVKKAKDDEPEEKSGFEESEKKLEEDKKEKNKDVLDF